MDLGIANLSIVWYNIMCVNAHNKKYYKYGQHIFPCGDTECLSGKYRTAKTEGGNKNVGYFY